ncbi:MAG: hypothetical protein HN413_10405 [Chloroflexi bacterium]|nr:hypothetical protein [Chloroflexota bacterium]
MTSSTTRIFARRIELARQAHSWNLTPRDAIRIQTELRSKVVHAPLSSHPLQSVAGIDVGFPRGKTIARAAVALLEPTRLAHRLASAKS